MSLTSIKAMEYIGEMQKVSENQQIQQTYLEGKFYGLEQHKGYEVWIYFLTEKEFPQARYWGRQTNKGRPKKF